MLAGAPLLCFLSQFAASSHTQRAASSTFRVGFYAARGFDRFALVATFLFLQSLL